MQRRTRTWTTLFTLGLICWIFPTMASAEEIARTLTVTGTGEVSAAPDIVTLSAGVTTTAVKAKDALAENSKAMNQIFAAMKAFGIAEKDIQTSNFSVSPQYENLKASSGRSGPRPIIGYFVTAGAVAEEFYPTEESPSPAINTPQRSAKPSLAEKLDAQAQRHTPPTDNPQGAHHALAQAEGQ